MRNSTSQPSSTATPSAKTPLLAGQAPPPKKRVKLTPAEKKAKEDEAAARKQELEKKKKEAEAAKALKEQQKELKRAEKEKAEKAKEEKKKETERRAREKQEEAERKARAQPKIANFFTKPKEPATKPEVKDAVVKARSPSPVARSTEYEKLAQPFFVHQHVRLAKSIYSMDEETRKAKLTILDDHLTGKRPPVSTKPFNPVETLQLVAAPRPRGRLYPSVRELMSEQYSMDQTAEAQKLQAEKTRQTLKGIRMKQLSFHEDVRPGYYGTITSVQSLENLRKLAKNPIAKDLPLNYDYDSEAEWVQGDEEPDDEGEDLDDEEDEEEDDDKSIDEFLDDSEDVARVRGPYAMGNLLEPEVSGICFEDQERHNPNSEMRKFQMEFIIRKHYPFCNITTATNRSPANLAHDSIDPFSSEYWPSDPEPATATSNKAGKTKFAKTLGTGINGMPPPPAPNGAAIPIKPVSAADLVPAAQLEDFKATIVEFKFLPKAALIPTLKKKFDKCTAGQIKATLEHVAEKPSKKGDWQIKGTA